MLHNSSLALWVNQRILFVCSFSPIPLIVFLVAMKKCAMPLSEPLDDHRPRSEMACRSWRFRGAEWVSPQLFSFYVSYIVHIFDVFVYTAGRILLTQCFIRFELPYFSNVMAWISHKYSWERNETHLILPSSYGLNSTTSVLLQGLLWL